MCMVLGIEELESLAETLWMAFVLNIIAHIIVLNGA
jgi:hypothetical protein